MKVRLLNALQPRRRKLLLWVVSLVLAYTIIGFLILPPIIRAVAAKQLAKQLDRSVTIQKVKLNPYTLAVTIRGLLIKDKDAETFVSWDEVYVNFQLVSFFTRPWVFKEISTSQPYVRVQMNKDYTLNFSDLVQKFSTNTAATKPSKPLALRVEALRIRGARAFLADLTPREPFHRTVGPLNITLTKFYTDPSNKNPYSFAGTNDSGERFSWSGYFYLDPIRSQGEFTLQGVSLNKFAPLYQDLVRFDIRDGVFDVRATYQVEKSAATNLLAMTNTTFRLKSLKVAEKGSEQDIAELGEVAVVGMSADASTRRADIASITARDGLLGIRRNKDGSVNALELAKPAETATNAPGGVLVLLQAVTNAFAMLLQSSNLWTGAIHDINVTNCSLHLEDLANARPVRLDLNEIALSAKEISNIPGTNMTAALSLRWDTNGAIRTELEAALAPHRADVKLALDNLDLRPLDPYLDPYVDVRVRNSKLGVDGTIHLRRTNEALPDVTFQGNVRLEDFSTVDGVMREDFVKLGSLRISGIDANLNPPVVSVKELAVDDASARLVIETNRTINLLTALHLGETNVGAGGLVQGKPPKGKRGQKEPAVAQETAQPSTNAPASLPPAKISVSSILISNSHLQFTDRSLQPVVNASIEQVSGNISGLSSDGPQRTDVSLRAKVDKTAPVEVTGKLNPLNQKQPIDLKVVIKDIDLHPAGPYSSKFLGYRLHKGKFSMDVTCNVADRKLKSENVIVVDQLMLGEKVDSPDATKLPVRLAIAVLKDRNGKIQLDVPIDGSLDDPQFRLGNVISGAILNIITKIVTSPFAALGAIFGGKGEEISFQDFDPGRSDLLPASVQKLDSLVKGLYERPGLQLEIEGSVDSRTDLEALRRQKLEKEFRLTKWKSLRKSEQARITPDEVQLAAEERVDYLKARYAVVVSPQNVAARSNATATAAATARSNSTNRADKLPIPARTGSEVGFAEKGATTLMKPLSLETRVPTLDMEGQVLETIEVTTNDFRAVAVARAERVKEYLLKTGKVEPERIFLTQPAAETVTLKGSRVYLHLQ